MKRTLIMLTLFCLFLSGTVGIAEDTQKEILFRGIPWGISLTDFVETMETSGFSGTVSSDNTINSWEWGAGRSTDYTYSLKDAGYIFYSNDDTTVAGIPVGTTRARFMYSFDSDHVYTEESKSELYYASYTFKPVDIASVLPILEEKLNRLYGEGEEADHQTNVTNWSGNDYIQHEETTTWYGANHTGVRLYVEYNYDKVTKETSYKELRLEYGKTNSVDMLHALKDAQAREEVRKIQSNDSVDGL